MTISRNPRDDRDNRPAALATWTVVGVLTAVAYVFIFAFSPHEPASAPEHEPVAAVEPANPSEPTPDAKMAENDASKKQR